MTEPDESDITDTKFKTIQSTRLKVQISTKTLYIGTATRRYSQYKIRYLKEILARFTV